MNKLKLCMLAVLLFTQFYANAQEMFDPNFGENGISNLGAEKYDVQFQGEDKMITISQDSWDEKVILHRINLDGSIDETFGNNGIFESYGHWYGSWNLVLDSEDNIYFASCKSDTIKVTKVTPNGTLDESFGNYGHAEVLTSDVALNTYVTMVAIDNNGKLIATGDYTDIVAENDRIIVARFNQDGSVDTDFGQNGLYLNPEIPNQDAQRNSGKTIIYPDNSIVVSGYVFYSGGSQAGMLAVKINSDGTIDDTFADGGMYSIIPDGYSSFRGGSLMGDNSIILYGSESNTSGYKGMVTKLSADGELDTSFGNNGYGECFYAGTDTIVSYYDAILKDNEIIVTGDILDLTPFKRSTIITKLNLDGTPIDNYGENGSMIISSTSIERPSLRAFALTEKDDEYYFAGSMSNEDSQAQGVIYKLIDQNVHVYSFDKVDFAVYPNPARDFININSENLIEDVSVYNTVGQKIFEETMAANNYRISTSQFKKGVYLVKAKVNGSYTSMKLLIE